MKLASLKSSSPDGELVVVSDDLTRAVRTQAIAPDLITALRDWATCGPALEALSVALKEGRAIQAFAFDPHAASAPLPRAPQWLDASAYLNHARLMERVFNLPEPVDSQTVPLMYQGASDDLLGPHDDFHAISEDHGIDFEGEFGVIVDDVPMGCSAETAGDHIRLVVLINDWSLRSFGSYEMSRGFGWIQAKPSTAFSAVAVTPDSLGLENWRDHRPQMTLNVAWNDRPFGRPHGGALHFSFGDLIAHAARTRRLTAGTIVGSGTVSNADRAVGSACISERRALDILDTGAPQTPFMRFGDRVKIWASTASNDLPFGAIDQQVIRNV